MPWRYAASATVSPALASMNRVTPSSKLNAMEWVMTAASQVVNIDDLTNVVVLQDHFLGQDQRFFTAHVEGVETAAEIAVDGLVTKAQGVPVETHLAQTVGLFEQLDVADVVGGASVRHAGAGALGLDAEDAVFQAGAVAVPDQRDFPLWIFGQLVVVVPRRHPERCIRCVQFQPFVPLAVVEVARFAVEKVGHGVMGNRHCTSSTAISFDCSAARALSMVCCQYLCCSTNRPSSSVRTPLSSGCRSISLAASSAPSIQCSAPRDMSFQVVTLPW